MIELQCCQKLKALKHKSAIFIKKNKKNPVWQSWWSPTEIGILHGRCLQVWGHPGRWVRSTWVSSYKSLLHSSFYSVLLLKYCYSVRHGTILNRSLSTIDVNYNLVCGSLNRLVSRLSLVLRSCQQISLLEPHNTMVSWNQGGNIKHNHPK
jgi:hypothetical protein